MPRHRVICTIRIGRGLDGGGACGRLRARGALGAGDRPFARRRRRRLSCDARSREGARDPHGAARCRRRRSRHRPRPRRASGLGIDRRSADRPRPKQDSSRCPCRCPSSPPTRSRDDYAPVLPEAAERIAVAVDYLRAKGVRRSPSSPTAWAHRWRMHFWRGPARPAIDAWAPVGMSGAFAVAPKEPVLDVVAETEIVPVSASAPARIRALPRDACSRQVIDRRRGPLFRIPAEGARRGDRGVLDAAHSTAAC